MNEKSLAGMITEYREPMLNDGGKENGDFGWVSCYAVMEDAAYPLAFRYAGFESLAKKYEQDECPLALNAELIVTEHMSRGEDGVYEVRMELYGEFLQEESHSAAERMYIPISGLNAKAMLAGLNSALELEHEIDGEPDIADEFKDMEFPYLEAALAESIDAVRAAGERRKGGREPEI